MEQNKFLVCVRCMTFNHAPYIVDAMNGFAMQQTSFPFVCCILDDASTDGEPEVIRQYLQDNFDLEDKTVVRNEETDDYVLTFARHKTNVNCFFAVFFLKYNHYKIKSKLPYIAEWNENAKYVALCEGDDYWIHLQKLQMQYDFMESHENYSCCYTKYKAFSQSKNKMVRIGGLNYKNIYEMLWKDVIIATCTFFYRNKCLEGYVDFIKEESRNWLMGDKPLFFYLGHKGFTKLLGVVSSVYRVLPESASHSSNLELQLTRAQNTIDIYMFFANRFFPNDIVLKKQIEGGLLYRQYVVYIIANVPLPQELRNTILHYKGKYLKLHFIKLFIVFPWFGRCLYSLKRKINVWVRIL